MAQKIVATVSGRLVVKKKDLPKRVLDVLYQDLSWENPEYKDAKIRGMRVDRIPRYVYGIKYVSKTDSYYVAREYWPEFCAVSDQMGYEVELNDKRAHHEPKPLEHNITLWKSQKSATKRMLDPENGHQGVLKAPCGSGKTNMLLYIAAVLGQPTLVLVHTNDLIHQWQQRCQQFLGIKAGIIQGNKVDLQQITIASVMTLAQRKLTPEFLGRWGCVMLDEAHHCPASSFQNIMTMFPAYYRYGATATPGRADDLQGLLFAICGDIIATITYDDLEKEHVIVRPRAVIKETGFAYQYRGIRFYQQMVRAIVNSNSRNRLIVDNIVANAPGHTQLVLSKQIDHLVLLHDACRERGLRTALIIAGGGTDYKMSKAERIQVLEDTRAGKIDALFGTSLADEGLDLPRLDRLHLTFPTRAESKVEQQVGRIQRVFPGKTDAIVFDYVDNVSILRDQAADRRRAYKEMGLEVVRK